MMRYFESHAHYDDERYNDDRDALLQTLLPEAGVRLVVNVSADMDGVRAGAALAAAYDYVYATVGVHPHYANDMTDDEISALYEAAKAPKVVAIGEIGLDYHYDNLVKENQRRRFSEQLELAKFTGLPVVIHSRDAAMDTFDILKESGIGKTNGGVIHCYSGSAEMAADYVRLGFHIGIGGVVTFRNARTLVETAAAIPLERLLIETDCPYLAPEPHRGERNDSRYLRHINSRIAEIRGVSPEETAAAAWANGAALFRVGAAAGC